MGDEIEVLDDFVVDPDYDGFVFLGWARGSFVNDRGAKIPFQNIFVIAPISKYESEDYQAFGLKAEKLKCVSPNVWEGFKPGEKVKIFFDQRGRVSTMALDE